MQLLFELPAFGDVPVDDHQLLHFPVLIAHHAGRRFHVQPAAVLMPNAIFHGSAHPRAPRVARCIDHRFSIVRMDLLESRRLLQLLPRIAQQLLVGGAVVEPLPIHIHHRDHVRRVFADQSE